MKKQKKKRLIALAMVMLMVLSLTQNVTYTPVANDFTVQQGGEIATVSDAVPDTTDDVSTSEVVTEEAQEDFVIEQDSADTVAESEVLNFLNIVNGVTITPGSSEDSPVDMSQQFTIKMNFELPADSEKELKDNYIYAFDLSEIAAQKLDDPTEIEDLIIASNTETSLPIVMGNEQVGVYTIVDGIVTLDFSMGIETLTGDKNASRVGEFKFNCGLDASKLDDEGGTYTLKFNTVVDIVDPQIIFSPKTTIDAGVDIEKSQAVFDAESMTATYTITVNNKNNSPVENVVITDYMGTYLELIKSSVSGATPTKTNDWSNEWNFTIDSVPSGETKITYTCDVDSAALFNANNQSGTSNGLDNSISAKVDDRSIYIDAESGKTSQKTEFSVSKDIVFKDVSMSSDNSVATWTIIINAGTTELDLSGYEFKDTLDEDLEYVRGSVKVTSTVENDPNIAGIIAAIETDMTSKEASYTFPEGSTATYTIEYKTNVPEMAGINYYNNTAVVTDGTNTDTASKDTPGIGSSISSKTYVGDSDPNVLPEADENGDLILNWMSTIAIPKDSISFVYVDYIKEGIWENGVKFNGAPVITYTKGDGSTGTLEAVTDYDVDFEDVEGQWGNPNEHHMTITLTSDGINKVNEDGKTVVEITYSTIGRYNDRYANDNQAYKNHYKVTVDSIIETGTASIEKYYQESVGSGGISKQAASVNTDDQTIDWQITVDIGAGNTLKNLKLVDTVTDMSYSGYSYGNNTYEYTDGGDMYAIIRAEKDYSLYTIPMKLVEKTGSDGHPVYTYEIDFGSSKITRLQDYGVITDPANLVGDNIGKIDIFYTTKVTGDYQYYNHYATPYTNKVVATQNPDGEELEVGESTVTKEMDTEILTKECITLDGEATSKLEYSIKVNPEGLDLNPSDDYYVIEDDLPENLIFVTDGTVVKDAQGNVYTYVKSAETVKAAEIGEKIYHVSFENSVIKFTVPDEVALTINYKVSMLADPTSGSKQYVNSVKLEEPYVMESSSNTSSVSRKIASSSATMISILFNVDKVNSQDVTEKLGGAEFKLEEYTYENGVWNQTPTNTYTATTVAGEVLSSTDFKDASGNRPEKANRIYVLSEEKAPLGYEKTDLTYKFIVLDDDSEGTVSDWANRLNGIDDVYRIMPGSTFVFSNTPLTTFVPNKLTITKEYYEADGITAVTSLPTNKAVIQIFEGELTIKDCQSGSYTPLATGDLGNGFTYSESYGQSTGHIITLENVPDGTYTVYEKSAPEGYDLLDRVYTFKAVDGKVQWDNDALAYEAAGTLENKATYDNSITITKRYFKASDTTKTAPLTTVPEEAVFTCTNMDTNQVVTIESVAGKEGFEYKISKLPAGTYVFNEVESEYYNIDSPLPYTIEVSALGNIKITDKNGDIVDITLLGDKDAEFTIDNVIKDNSITINKTYYNEDGNKVDGSSVKFSNDANQQKVIFTLYESNGSAWTEVTSSDNLYENYTATNNTNWDDNYTWKNLEPGNYKIVESLADGDDTKYEPVADTIFTVGTDYRITVTNGDSNVYETTVEVKNKEISGDKSRFYLVKQLADQSGNLTAASESDGITFKLVKIENDAETDITTGFVYNSTTKRWESTSLGEGKYKLTESTTKSGYAKALGTVEFEIDSSSNIVEGSVVYSNGESKDFSFVTEKNGTAETLVCTLINRPYENKITVTKNYVQPDGTVVTTTPNPAAKFSLYSIATGGAETLIETLSGPTDYVFDKLEPGDYVIRETTTPTGYTSCGNIEFNVAVDYTITYSSLGTDVVVDSNSTSGGYNKYFVATNTLTNEFVFTKQFTYLDGNKVTDTTNYTTLFSATEFKLYKDDVEVGAPVTVTKGTNTITIKNLSDGTYTLKETSTPDGFTSAGNITLTVSNGKISATYGGTRTDFTDLYNNGTFNVSATLYNRQSENKLTITKKYFDADGDELALSQVAVKASFVIKDANGKSVTSYTFSPNSGTYTFKNFVPGTYTITENAPSGFEKIADATFTVDANGKITFVPQTGWTVNGGDGTVNLAVTAENTMKSNLLTLSKIYLDPNGNTKTVAVTPDMEKMFTLVDANGSVVETLSYDSNTGKYYADNLMPGTYTLKEEVPAGYMPVIGKLTVVVAVDGTISASYTGGDTGDFKMVGSGTLTNANIEFKNHEVTNVVTINKNYVSSTGVALPIEDLEDAEKATFKLYNTVTNSEITDTDIVQCNKDTGVYAFVNLPEGYYRIEEVEGAGFEARTAITFSVNKDKEIISISGATATSDSTEFSKVFNIENERKPFDNKLTLSKAFINQGGEAITGAEYDSLLGDVVFKMYDADDKEVTGFAYDSSTGKWVVKQLEPGTYTIKETDCNDNYVAAGDIEVVVTKTAPEVTTISVTYLGNNASDMTVTQDANNLSEIEINLDNHQKVENYFAIDKKYVDAFGNEITDEAVITDLRKDTKFVYKASNSTVATEMPYDATAKKYVLEDLQTGTYTISETAPDGFIAISDITLTVANDGKITVTYGGEASDVVVTDSTTELNTTTAVVMNSHKGGNVNIGKYDMVNGEELPGATLRITDEDGNLIEEWISTESLHKIDVDKFKAGEEYTLTEITAPFGYEIAENIVFKLDIYGNVYIKSSDGTFALVDDNTVAMKDAHKYVNISKVDLTNDEELPGAKLIIKDADGNVIDEWTSTKDKHQISMTEFEADVEYSLTEITAPDGYEVAETIVFKFDSDGNIYVKDEDGEFQKLTSDTIVMKDAPTPEETTETTTEETTETTTTEVTTSTGIETSTDSPKTGDKAQIPLMAVIMLLSCGGLVYFRRGKKYLQ